jgi:hypothetical protein
VYVSVRACVGVGVCVLECEVREHSVSLNVLGSVISITFADKNK